MRSIANTACLTFWAFVLQYYYHFNVLLFPTNMKNSLSRALAKSNFNCESNINKKRESNFNCGVISVQYEHP